MVHDWNGIIALRFCGLRRRQGDTVGKKVENRQILRKANCE